MALISDAIVGHGCSTKVSNMMVEIVRQMQEEFLETADYDFCEGVVLNWLVAIGAVAEKGTNDNPKYKLVKGCSAGGIFCEKESLNFYVPGNVENTEVEEMLFKFLKVRSHTYRFENTWNRATEGWVMWAVLTEMLERGEAYCEIRKNKMTLRLAPSYLAEVRTLAAV